MERKSRLFAAFVITLLPVSIMLSGCGTKPTNNPPLSQTTSSPPSPSPSPPPQKHPIAQAISSSSSSAPSPFGQPNPLIRVYMADKDKGWAFTLNGILRTSDGGKTWVDGSPRAMLPIGQYDPHMMDFLDASTAWIIGGQGNQTLYHTTNSGKTWSAFDLPSVRSHAAGPMEVYFTDSDHGWMVIDLGAAAGTGYAEIYRTSNSGQNWKKEGEWVNGVPTGLGTMDATTAWLGEFSNVNGHVVTTKTIDGGLHWKTVNLPLPSQYQPKSSRELAPSFGTFPPQFFSAKDGIMPVIPNYGMLTMVFYVTHDGGLTWTPTTPVQSADDSVPVYDFIDSKHGWIVPGIGLFATNDEGETWTSVNKLTNADLFWKDVEQIDFVSKTSGWVVRQFGDSTQLMRTIDGGKNWVILHTWK